MTTAKIEVYETPESASDDLSITRGLRLSCRLQAVEAGASNGTYCVHVACACSVFFVFNS
jgi:hypothetical protein